MGLRPTVAQIPDRGGGKKEYARPGINDGRVLNRELLGEFGAVIKKPCPMGRKSNAR